MPEIVHVPMTLRKLFFFERGENCSLCNKQQADHALEPEADKDRVTGGVTLYVCEDCYVEKCK